MPFGRLQIPNPNSGAYRYSKRIWHTRYVSVQDQRMALAFLVSNTVPSIAVKSVAVVARQIVAKPVCDGRDDVCELQAVYDAVKHGTDRVPGLEHGIRYTNDSIAVDEFFSPRMMIEEMLPAGAAAGDCDDQAALVACLLAEIGWQTGFCAWQGSGDDDFVHVFAVAKFPKHSPEKLIALDTTVDQADVGWAPPDGKFLIAWIPKS